MGFYFLGRMLYKLYKKSTLRKRTKVSRVNYILMLRNRRITLKVFDVVSIAQVFETV